MDETEAGELIVEREEKWKARGAGLWLEGEGDRDSQICSILWADNFWIMSENEAGLQRTEGSGRTNRQQGNGTEKGIT